MKSGAPIWRRAENGVALLCTIAFLASWAAIAHSSLSARPAVSAPPAAVRMRWLPDAEAGPGASVWDRDPRALWSPVLFALPTAVGFSPDRTRQGARAPAVAGVPPAGDLLLGRNPRPEPGPAPAPLHGRTPMEIADLQERRWAAIPAPADPFSIASHTNSLLHVEWPDGSPEFLAGVPLGLQPPPLAGERGWEVSALLYFNDGGEVRSVFIEQSTAPRERGESVQRALRRLRIVPGRADAVRVNLYLQAPPAPARNGAAS